MPIIQIYVKDELYSKFKELPEEKQDKLKDNFKDTLAKAK
jgi:hypothetical protein